MEISSLLVDWIKYYLIRDHSFWKIPLRRFCSWTWRKILQLREEIRPLIQYSIGNGLLTRLWFDPWLPIGPIAPLFGDRIIYGPSLPRQAHVESVIHNGQWAWLVANSLDLLTLKQAIPDNWHPDPHRGGEIIWLPSSTGTFSTNSTWQALRTKHTTIWWHKLVWFSKAIPKCGFFLWLAFHGRLGTQDRLHIDSSNLRCLLC